MTVGANTPGTAPLEAARTLEPAALLGTPLGALLRRAPVIVGPAATIREAATLMRDRGVSSLLVVDDTRLVGIVTDRDLRSRAIAAGVDTDRAVLEIATRAPRTLDLRATAFDAALLMARHDVHHVPVLDGVRLAGMISASDLAVQDSTAAIFVVREVFKQPDVAGLQQAARRVESVQRSAAAANASAYACGQMVTAVTDAVTTRLLQLAQGSLGPAPVAFAWVAAGSQARGEQTAHSDQDNCLVLDDAYDPVAHGDYFRALARFVCDGLDACGYAYCPGAMMAMTDAWRQPVREWRRYFQQWIHAPDPRALMLTCVFFDLRAVSGDAALVDDLRREVLAATPGNRIFLAHMVANALSRRPPLGLFGRLAPARTGPHRGTLDLKHLGIVPVVDLARIYALAGGSAAVNTYQRLEGAAGAEVTAQSARDLRDALAFIAALRTAHQVRQGDAGRPLDNFLDPHELSNFERTQLKDAFVVVQSLQRVLERRYAAVLAQLR